VTKLRRLMFMVAACWPAAAMGQEASTPPEPSLSQALAKEGAQSSPGCKDSDPTEVVVCGRSQQRYRIDPDMLAAIRAVEAPPPKPALDATNAGGCIGPNCGGGTIPLVAMALTALKAAELAAEGDDWKEAFRTHPDQYQAYQQSKKGRVSIGVTAGNRRTPPGAGY
jgi:hypothetical protein